MIAPQSSTAKAPRQPNKLAGEGGDLNTGFDLFRLDCAVDALRGRSLSANDRAELARIAANLADIMETRQ